MPTKFIFSVIMNSPNSSRNIIKVIKERSIEDALQIFSYWIPYYIRENYIEDNYKVNELSSKIQDIINTIIEKIIANFGDIPNIVKYCLVNYYDIGEIFTSKDLCEKIENFFKFSERNKIRKVLSNELKLKNPKIRIIERGKYIIISRN